MCIKNTTLDNSVYLCVKHYTRFDLETHSSTSHDYTLPQVDG